MTQVAERVESESTFGHVHTTIVWRFICNGCGIDARRRASCCDFQTLCANCDRHDCSAAGEDQGFGVPIFCEQCY